MQEFEKKPKKTVFKLGEFYPGNKSLDDMLDWLHSQREKNKHKFERLFFHIEFREDEWNRPDAVSVQLLGERMETYEETEARVKEQLLREENARERMRQQYENLKVMFEPQEAAEDVSVDRSELVKRAHTHSKKADE